MSALKSAAISCLVFLFAFSILVNCILLNYIEDEAEPLEWFSAEVVVHNYAPVGVNVQFVIMVDGWSEFRDMEMVWANETRHFTIYWPDIGINTTETYAYFYDEGGENLYFVKWLPLVENECREVWLI